MKRIKFEFDNAEGQTLAGLLEMPAEVVSYAIFAHCFTCGKDIAAASRISRALTTSGIAVLRFDFTGLGSSDGDFANANFSSNISDLVAAANALTEAYASPSMLIGHSLGGAAVLNAALQLDSIKAVVTIGAPASADHVAHLFASDLDEIKATGEARVNLGGRGFNIKRQFLDDIANFASTDQYARLRPALLIFHSPIDKIVSIDEAARIYQAARHPKSFISLDQAD
ncbi:MAG: alpha/beta fold hydrolase, partial [Gammaproteobacteria bacterium]|nr:alpha/beta fold hydrolase [Gammaproteobacteria bacterium]